MKDFPCIMYTIKNIKFFQRLSNEWYRNKLIIIWIIKEFKSHRCRVNEVAGFFYLVKAKNTLIF